MKIKPTIWKYKGNPASGSGKLVPSKTTFLTKATGSLAKLGSNSFKKIRK